MVNKCKGLSKLGSLLRKLRKERGLSLSKVSEEVGISYNFLSEIERGKKEPSNEKIMALSKFYEINEDDLYIAMNKIPHRAEKYMLEDIELQKILSEVYEKHHKNKDKYEEIKGKIITLYKDILKDD